MRTRGGQQLSSWGVGNSQATRQQLGMRKQPRYESHALVEVQTSRWNPFSIRSAVLLDISQEGMKIEFVSPVKVPTLGSTYKVSIPLTPFGIAAPSKITLNFTIKWFDARNFRAGGLFAKPGPNEYHLLERIIQFVVEKSTTRKP